MSNRIVGIAANLGNSRSNCHHLDLGVDASVEFVALEGKGNIPRWLRKSFFGSAKVDRLKQTASGAKYEPQMPLIESSWSDGRSDHSRREDGLRVAHSIRLKQSLHFKKAERDIFHRQFGIEAQLGREDVVVHARARGNLECPAKLFEAILVHGHAGSHLMSAKFFEMTGTLPQRVDERKPFDATATAFAKPAFIEPNQQRRPMMSAHHTGRDDSEHSMVPLTPACNDARMDGGIVVFFDPLLDFEDQVFFNALPGAILAIKAVRQLRRFADVVAEQKAERFERGAETARSIDAWSETKPDIAAAKRRTHIGNCHQCRESWPPGACHPLETSVDQDSIFADQGN